MSSRRDLGFGKRLRLSIALASTLLVAGTIVLYGYTKRPSPLIRAHKHHPPGSIIGNQSPDLIPDDVAYRQVLNTIAGMAADPTRAKALEAYFRHIEMFGGALTGKDRGSSSLSERDRQTIRAISLDLHLQSRAHGSNRSALAAEALTELRNELSPEAAELIGAFIAGSVKRNMKILRR